MSQNPLFNLDSYIDQLSEDLNLHATLLHTRDVTNLMRFVSQPPLRRHSAPEFTMPPPVCGVTVNVNNQLSQRGVEETHIKAEPPSVLEEEIQL